MNSKEALEKLSYIPIYEEDEHNIITDINNCCVYKGDLYEIYGNEVDTIKKDLEVLEEYRKIEEEKSNDNNEEGLKNEEEKQKNESDNNKTDDTDKKEEEQKQEKVSLPIIDKEKEKLKEKINEYHFVEKIAQEPVTYKSNKYRYSKESIQYNQSDSY